jgi:hypothetical protein
MGAHCMPQISAELFIGGLGQWGGATRRVFGSIFRVQNGVDFAILRKKNV